MKIFSQIVGGIGACLVAMAYVLVSYKKVQGDSRIYQLMNFLGAIGVGINASYQKAWPSFALQIVWGAVAIVALVKNIKRPSTHDLS